METETQIRARFSEDVHDDPLFLPDFSVWFEWHARENSLPAPTLEEITRQLGVPYWNVSRPWVAKTRTTELVMEDKPGERLAKYRTESGDLTAKWTVGPDGDYWQSEYPVKQAADLKAVLEIASDRIYTIAPENINSRPAPGEAAVLDLPLNPMSALIYEFLGLSEGLMLLWDEPEIISDIIDAFEDRLQSFIPEFSDLPGSLVLSPDNLDSQFVSPVSFKNYYSSSYRRTADVLHSAGKKLIVHAGGPVGNLLEELGKSGVDGIEGIAGTPQGDTDLSTAREKAGPDLTLWGGIPQDFVLETRNQGDFEDAVRAACRQVRGQSRMILGVADRVPPQASLERLKSIPELIKELTDD